MIVIVLFVGILYFVVVWMMVFFGMGSFVFVIVVVGDFVCGGVSVILVFVGFFVGWGGIVLCCICVEYLCWLWECDDEE